jgi:RND family efflux transporter MFP subunit
MPVTDAFKLVIDTALKMRAAVPERYSASVHVDQPVDIRVEAYPGVVFVGRVTRVNPTVDPQSRTFQAEIAVPNLDGRLKAGGFARAAVRVRTDAGVPTAPPAAVHTFAGVSKVFVIESEKARAVPVEVGARDKDWVELIGDVPPGATVATSGFAQLVDGSPVKVRQPESEKAPGPPPARSQSSSGSGD